MGLLVETGYQQPIATLSCSDSQLSVSQAKGHMGLQHLDEAFLCLRGSCQLLEHALGEDLLDVCHIYGHNNEPINEFTDHVAKMEAANGFYFQRPSLNLKLWKSKIPHLWLLFEHDHGGPSLGWHGLDISQPYLPARGLRQYGSLDNACRSNPISVEITLSYCTANVLSLCAGPKDMQAKLDTWQSSLLPMAFFLVVFKKLERPKVAFAVDRCKHFAPALSRALEVWNSGSTFSNPTVMKADGLAFFDHTIAKFCWRSLRD